MTSTPRNSSARQFSTCPCCRGQPCCPGQTKSCPPRHDGCHLIETGATQPFMGSPFTEQTFLICSLGFAALWQTCSDLAAADLILSCYDCWPTLNLVPLILLHYVQKAYSKMQPTMQTKGFTTQISRSILVVQLNCAVSLCYMLTG